MLWLLAPDKFKGTYTAGEVASALAKGIGEGVDLCPTADGGEGTLAVLLDALSARSVAHPAHDPLGRGIEARIGVSADGALAIVESATASGLGLLRIDELDPERASTFGTGELLVGAVASGARRVVLAVGGSACTDGGAGAIEAIELGGGLRRAELIVLADVNTPFELAAERFGEQKGADIATIQRMTARLHGLADGFTRDPRGVPMTGAAGGLAGGLWARYGASIVPGAAWVLDALDFDRRLAKAHAVITGEGRLDASTLEGKLVSEIAKRCQRTGVPLHAVVGSSQLSARELRRLGLSPVLEASDLDEIARAGRMLTRT